MAICSTVSGWKDDDMHILFHHTFVMMFYGVIDCKIIASNDIRHPSCFRHITLLLQHMHEMKMKNEDVSYLWMN